MATPSSSEHKKPPLRVLIVAPGIQHLVGGQEVQADLLVRFWRRDKEVCVSQVTTNLPLPPLLQSVPYLRTLLRFPVYLTQLIARTRRADIVHVFAGAFSSFLIGVVPAYCIGRIFRKKVIVNYHSGMAKLHLSASIVARRTLLSADKVIVPSGYLVDVFREFGIAAHPIANVVDSDNFSYRQRRRFHPLLLCARNLEAQYGIDTVLRAFDKVQQAFPEARLSLLGVGSQQNTVQRLIADLDVRGVEMVGRVPRDKIGQFYETADILINGSRVDNMPVSILEAFASGIAVATSNAGGIPYIVEHQRTGMLSDPEDWKQLAANVIRLLQDPSLGSCLTENAYRQSITYQWDVVRAHWLNVYQELQRP